MDIVPEVVVFLAYRKDGSKVRPSDWAERLACSAAKIRSYGDIEYSKFCTTTCCSGGCGLTVHLRQMKEENPDFYEHLMWFAETNNIEMAECS